MGGVLFEVDNETTFIYPYVFMSPVNDDQREKIIQLHTHTHTMCI